MYIIRDGKKIELTRQELYDASEAYERLTAEEVVRDRIASEVGITHEDIPEDVMNTAVESYLNSLRCECEESYAINMAVAIASATLKRRPDD